MLTIAALVPRGPWPAGGNGLLDAHR